MNKIDPAAETDQPSRVTKTSLDFRALTTIAKACHENARFKGFWDCTVCDGKGEAMVTTIAESISVNVLCPMCDGRGLHRNTGEMLMLVVSELGEAIEALRNSDVDAICDKCNGYIADPAEWKKEFSVTSKACLKCLGTGRAIGGSRFAEEAADAIIRLFDLCARRGIDIGAVVEAKFNYNATRPHKHGKDW